MALGLDDVGGALAIIESPWILAAAGVAALVASPKLREGARNLAVKGAAGAMVLADRTKQATAEWREEWQDMMAEARAQQESPAG